MNRLDEPVDASIAIVGDEIYLRGHEHLLAPGVHRAPLVADVDDADVRRARDLHQHRQHR